MNNPTVKPDPFFGDPQSSRVVEEELFALRVSLARRNLARQLDRLESAPRYTDERDDAFQAVCAAGLELLELTDDNCRVPMGGEQ